MTVHAFDTSDSAYRPQWRFSPYDFAQSALRAAAGSWVLAAIVGQALFVAVVASLHYGTESAQGDLAMLTRALSPGFLMGATKSNFVIAEYAALAVIGALAGIAQFIPQIQNHAPYHRLAQRLFVVTNGVWLFQVGLFTAMLYTGSAALDTSALEVSLVAILSFAQYFVPLVMLELYVFARDEAGTASRMAMTAGLVILTDLMVVGIYELTQFVSLPGLI